MERVDAPITAVTVHPSIARVTRIGRTTAVAGSNELLVAGLPTGIDESSVRVAGRSTTPTRVVGVDIAARRGVAAPDPRVAAAEAALRDAERALGAIDDEDAGEEQRQWLLRRVVDRSGKAFAAGLASGDAELDRLAGTAASLATEIEASAARRRALAERRADATRAVEAARFELERLRASGRDRRDVVVQLEADGGGDVELELTYAVYGASWRPTYDVRVDGDGGPIDLTWGAVITQATGEDWPECELTVSTSEPQLAAAIPELDPWWVGAHQPPAPRMAQLAAGGADLPPAPMAAAPVTVEPPATAFVAMKEIDADVLDTTLAAAWKLPRPTAVPADGAPHRAVLATGELASTLDHVAAPDLGTEVHLRATVTNTTGRALVPGTASVYLDDAFVGTAAIEGVAPGAELELALGVDDRVVVERELVRRDDDRKRLGSTRRSVESWKVEVTNHRSAAINLVVRSRVPTSRHAEVKVVDVRLKPEPAEHDDLGRVEWRAPLAAGATWRADLTFGVEHPKDLPLAGWR